MNFERYPWLQEMSSSSAIAAIENAKVQFESTGAVTFPEFITSVALADILLDARKREDRAFTTDDAHNVHLLPADPDYPEKSVRNYEMRTKVASIAYDELPENSKLAELYRDPIVRQLIAAVVSKESLYLSDDPLGCCSINVFRPGYHHSFHFDESEFSTTLMLQEASVEGTGLFQYTHPLRKHRDDLALHTVAAALKKYEENDAPELIEIGDEAEDAPELHTLEFSPGTLSIFSGAKSLHRVTKVAGDQSRLVAVLTFASQPGFRNSAKVQKLFWGRSSP
jgi:hypothetical protein